GETPRTRWATRTDIPARRWSPGSGAGASGLGGGGSYELLRVPERQPERLGDRRVDHASLDHVQALEERTVVAARLLPAAPRQTLGIRQRGAGERHGGR